MASRMRGRNTGGAGGSFSGSGGRSVGAAVARAQAKKLDQSYLDKAGPCASSVVNKAGSWSAALIGNLVLDELDGELEARGHRFAGYADDSNICAHSEGAGARGDGECKAIHPAKAETQGNNNEVKSAVAKSAVLKDLDQWIRRRLTCAVNRKVTARLIQTAVFGPLRTVVWRGRGAIRHPIPIRSIGPTRVCARLRCSGITVAFGLQSPAAAGRTRSESGAASQAVRAKARPHPNNRAATARPC